MICSILILIGHVIVDDVIIKEEEATKNLREDIDQEALAPQALVVLGHIRQDQDPAQGIEVGTDISPGNKTRDR